MRSQHLRIAIVGAGVGGLTLALALRQRGLSADLFEQAHDLAEIGAAVALSANGTHELERLGLLDAVVAKSTEPTELIFRHGPTGERIAAHPMRLDGAYRKRFGAPYFGIHRADLQRVLSGALGGEGLHLAHRLVDLAERDGRVTLTFANGAKAEADLVIAADGIRSTARKFVLGDDPLRYTRNSGFRGIVPAANLPSLPDPEAIQIWSGPGAHLVHYAIGPTGEHVNFLAVVEFPNEWTNPEKGLMPTTQLEALAFYKDWHPAVAEMVNAVRHELRWGLFATRPIRRWRRGRVVLLGDAAHGSLPHQGQGANATIEDSIVLAESIAGKANLFAALDAYESIRKPRTRQIQRASWAGNRASHFEDGPARDRRDRGLKRFPDWYGWIHGYDALGTAQRVGRNSLAAAG